MTTTYAMHELARRRDRSSGPGREALDAALELLEAENERAKVLGFKNHATAMVLLWLENERPMLERVTALTVDNRRARLEAPASYLGDALRELVESVPAVQLVVDPPNPPDMGHVADLLNAALDSVDWRELGEHFLATIEIAAAT